MVGASLAALMLLGSVRTREAYSRIAFAVALAVAVAVIAVNALRPKGAIADNYRCVSDRVIDAIARTGGVIGITAVNDFHVRARGVTGKMPQVGIDAHIDQYDYIKKRVGVEHVGMGTDFVDGLPLQGINRAVIPPDMIDEPWLYIKGFESIAELPNLLSGFKRRGWTDAEIGKAMGGNWLRVYGQVWAA